MFLAHRPSRLPLLLIASWLLTTPALGDSIRTEGLPEVSARESGWEHYGTSDAGADDYVMFTRTPEGSRFSAYRLEALFDAPTSVVAQVAAKHIIDPTNVQKNMEKTVLEQNERGALIHSYIHINAPFVSDRDVVTRVEFDSDPVSGAHVMRWYATDEGPEPESGVIRLGRSDGSWTFAPDASGKTRAIYTSHTELAGSIPAWILNSFMSGSMVESVTGLRDALQKELVAR